MTTETVTTPEDDFGAFFDQLASLGKNPVPADFGKAAASEPAPAPIETTETTAVEPDTTATETSAATGDGGEATTTAVEEPTPPPAVAQPAHDEASLLAKLVETLDKRQPPAPAPQPVPAPRLYTDEELGVLNQAQKDWPDLMNALGLMLRGATQQTQQTVFQQLGQVLGPQLEQMRAVSVDHQYDALHRAIPDYDAVAEPVIQWARTDKSIPPFLRKAYEGVIAEGEVSEIKHLVDTWRTATGKPAPAQANQAATARQATTQAKPVTPANELSEAAKQAAASLAPVVSKRTAVVTSAVPTSFDDAWDHFVKAAKT